MNLLNYEDLRARRIAPSKAQLHRLIKAGKFPKPIKITPGRNGWTEKQIDDYIAERIAEAEAKAEAA